MWAGTGPVDFTYQWLRCDLDGTNCTDIAGATDDTLHADQRRRRPRHPRRGHRHERRGLGHRHLAGRRRQRARAAEHGAAAISGTLVDGHTLTADHGTWSGTHAAHYDYQWLRCDAAGTNCVAIAGATGADLRRSTAADIGHEILVSVQATNVGRQRPGRLGARRRRRRRPTRRTPSPRRPSPAARRTAGR